MLELTKKQITSEVVEICLKVPTEDSQIIMDILKRVLEQAGYEVNDGSPSAGVTPEE